MKGKERKAKEKRKGNQAKEEKGKGRKGKRNMSVNMSVGRSGNMKRMSVNTNVTVSRSMI